MGGTVAVPLFNFVIAVPLQSTKRTAPSSRRIPRWWSRGFRPPRRGVFSPRSRLSTPRRPLSNLTPSTVQMTTKIGHGQCQYLLPLLYHRGLVQFRTIRGRCRCLRYTGMSVSLLDRERFLDRFLLLLRRLHSRNGSWTGSCSFSVPGSFSGPYCGGITIIFRFNCNCSVGFAPVRSPFLITSASERSTLTIREESAVLLEHHELQTANRR